ncbi:hypothetical protein Tco_1103633 [Tanacetum coccineum]
MQQEKEAYEESREMAEVLRIVLASPYECTSLADPTHSEEDNDSRNTNPLEYIYQNSTDGNTLLLLLIMDDCEKSAIPYGKIVMKRYMCPVQPPDSDAEIHNRRLSISWQCKKQTIVATSTTEAEYVAAASCCGQVLWIQNQMLDYGFNFMNTKIYIDNESTICIVKNPVYHSKTKHIAIRHHFIRDAYEKKLIQVLKIHTDDNVADLLTKAFDVSSTLATYIVLSLQALISLLTTISLSSTMAVLDSCLKHNMVAYLEKSEGNAEFPEIIDFLKRSSIHHALTISPVVSTTFVEQFWTSAKSKTINNVRHIGAAPSPRPSPTTTIPASIPETSGETLGGHSSNDKSLSGNKGDMTIQGVYDLCLSLCKQQRCPRRELLSKKTKDGTKRLISKQGRKIAKGESSVQRDHLFDVMPEDKIDLMETENAQSEGRSREMVDEDKEIDERRLSTEDVVSTGTSTDEQVEGTEEPNEGTDENLEGTKEQNEDTVEIFEGTEEQRGGTEEKVESTDGQIKGTEDQTEEEIATQTPTSMIFRDDETIATVLLNMMKRETKRMNELRLNLTIAQDEEKEVDYEILDRKYPIKEWKTECLGAKPQTD